MAATAQRRRLALAACACVCCMLLVGGHAFQAWRPTGASTSAPQQHLRGLGAPPAASEQLGLAGQLACAGLALGAVAAISLARGRVRPQAAKATLLKAIGIGGVDKETPTFSVPTSLVGSESAWGGRYEFDPLGFSEYFPDQLAWFREAELKHCRICMLAYVGLLVQDALPRSSLIRDADLITAHNKCIDGLGQGPMWILLSVIGVMESQRFKTMGLGFEKLTLENAGDLNFGKSFLPKTEEGIRQIKLKELKNGRLAMIAFGGAITQMVVWDYYHFPFSPSSFSQYAGYYQPPY